jgi:hypothetical protein
LYDHQLIIIHERSLRSLIVSATRQYEAALAKRIHAGIESGLLERWRQALVTPREAGLSQQSWLLAAPAKHSPRQIEELLERIETRYELGVHRHLVDVPDDLLRRYARRLANRPPSAGRLIREPVRTIEIAYFLRYCLLIGTDRVLLMVRRPGGRSMAPRGQGCQSGPDPLGWIVSRAARFDWRADKRSVLHRDSVSIISASTCPETYCTHEHSILVAQAPAE